MLTPSRLRIDPQSAKRIRDTVLTIIDPHRFPWLTEGRQPSNDERERAVIASAALAASSDVGTIRRNTSKEAQEQAVKDLLAGTGMKEVKARDIPMLTAAPAPSHFCGEARLAGTRADVVARLNDGRVMAIECKVSNSTVNSYKRLVHDTGGKAAHWYNQLGRAQVLPSAVLSGCSGSTAWQTSPPSSKGRDRARHVRVLSIGNCREDAGSTAALVEAHEIVFLVWRVLAVRRHVRS